jgi:hypothetical protein
MGLLNMPATFADYQKDASNWITLATGEYYPDILVDACLLYTPVIEKFGQLLRISATTKELFSRIIDEPSPWLRVQLLRIFKRYAFPEAPVEMTKRKHKAADFIRDFGNKFRAIHIIQQRYDSRPPRDEALCALLWEYKSRGQKGYDLTERFFELFRANFPLFPMTGPERAGKDVLVSSIFPDYPNQFRPVDFVIYNEDKRQVLAIGLARYDGDRGGAQEDDRLGGYRDCARELLTYAAEHNLPTKVIFINDGPGLLLGSMWRDYANIEASWHGKVMIATLRMVPERITEQWLNS